MIEDGDEKGVLVREVPLDRRGRDTGGCRDLHRRRLVVADIGEQSRRSTSFAGGHVISVAGQGEPLAAIIAQVPHVSGPAAVRATGLVPSLRVGIAGFHDQISAWTKRAPVYVDSAGRPGERAVMTTPDAVPGMDKLISESGLEKGDYPIDVAARIVLKIGLYSPRRWARGVTCPALVQIVDSDAITPRHIAEETAARMADPTVRVYPGGHFDPYVEPLFSTVIADQLAFLREHVPVAGAPS